MQVQEPIDVFISHDWPLGITDCGDWKQLVRFKPYFEKEVSLSMSRCSVNALNFVFRQDHA